MINITSIITVSPVNPANGRHEIHARTAEGIDVALQISPDALGNLTGYFGTFQPGDKEYARFIARLEKLEAIATTTKGP